MFAKKENLSLFLFLGFFLFALLFFNGCLKKTCFDAGNCPLSDTEYISIAKNTPEAKAFLQKYPDANIGVERTEYLAVDFAVGNVVFIDVSKGIYEGREGVPSLMLKVFIDPSTNKPTSAFIQCHTNEDYQGTDQNLVDYIKTEKCLK